MSSLFPGLAFKDAAEQTVFQGRDAVSLWGRWQDVFTAQNNKDNIPLWHKVRQVCRQAIVKDLSSCPGFFRFLSCDTNSLCAEHISVLLHKPPRTCKEKTDTDMKLRKSFVSDPRVLCPSTGIYVVVVGNLVSFLFFLSFF